MHYTLYVRKKRIYTQTILIKNIRYIVFYYTQTHISANVQKNISMQPNFNYNYLNKFINPHISDTAHMRKKLLHINTTEAYACKIRKHNRLKYELQSQQY